MLATNTQIASSWRNIRKCRKREVDRTKCHIALWAGAYATPFFDIDNFEAKHDKK